MFFLRSYFSLFPQHQPSPHEAFVVAVSSEQALVDVMDKAADFGILLAGCLDAKVSDCLFDFASCDVET